MKIISAAVMRELDRRTIEEFGTPGEVLMERAAQGLVTHLQELIRNHRLDAPAILLIAGKGNNGGDAIVAHRILLEMGLHASLWKVEETDWSTASPTGFDIIVDGLLGTGTSGAPRGKFAEAVAWINQTNAIRVSIDIPSGLHADTGEPLGETVRANLTVTMGLPKTGLLKPASIEYTGTVEPADIGIPEAYINAVDAWADAELITRSEIKLPRRPRDSHKGTYGHTLLIGGSPGMTGAIAMAAQAALRSGVGLVSVRVPEAAYQPVATAAGSEAMVKPFSELSEIDLNGFDSVLIGPGLGRTKETEHLIEQVLRNCNVPLVMDADALSVAPETIAEAPCPIILTPHPGEFATLFNTTTADVQKDRLNAVAAPEGSAGINANGNPGMAKGGSGDILAGLLAGLLAQGIEPVQAAKTAVWLHGKAGDIAAAQNTEQAMQATDLIGAFQSLLQSS
jgi:NAD(P)H-hydrate epimerase